MQVEFRGQPGKYRSWLHVDGDTLTEHAESAGWRCEIIHEEESGEYLAQLAKA